MFEIGEVLWDRFLKEDATIARVALCPPEPESTISQTSMIRYPKPHHGDHMFVLLNDTLQQNRFGIINSFIF
jgi:hypothetical protein